MKAKIILLRDWCEKYNFVYRSVLSLTYYKPVLAKLIEKRHTQIRVKRKNIDQEKHKNTRKKYTYKQMPMVYILDEDIFTKEYLLITRKICEINNTSKENRSISVIQGE